MKQNRISKISSRDRVITSLKHKEPDRVPFDFSSTGATEISIVAYEKILKYLGIEEKIDILSFDSQRAFVSEFLLKKLKVDTRGVYTTPPIHWIVRTSEDSEYLNFASFFNIFPCNKFCAREKPHKNRG